MDIIEKNWKKYAEKYKDLLKRFYQYQSIPYSVIVQTFSDLNLDVTVEQTSKMAGAEIDLYASLRQYKLPIGGRVYADIASPNGDSLKIELQSSKNGFFAGKFKSTTSGIYQIRLRANGRSLAGKRFTRETLRTVSLYKDNPVIPTEDSPQRDASLCAIIDCFLAQKGMREYLQKNHIDPDHLSKCLNSHCMEQFKGRSSSKGKISALGQAEMQMIDRFQSFITAKKDDDIISSVPEMREINYPEAEIPKHSKKALSMPVSPSVKLNEKGKLEIVRFKHKGAAKGKKPSGK